MSGVAEVGKEVVEACACAMTSAPPFIVMGFEHVSVAVEGMVGMAATSSTVSGALAGFMLAFSVGGPVRSGEDGVLGLCAVRSVSACPVAARTMGLHGSSAAGVDECLRSRSASRSHAGVSSSSGG